MFKVAHHAGRLITPGSSVYLIDLIVANTAQNGEVAAEVKVAVEGKVVVEVKLEASLEAKQEAVEEVE